MKTYSWEYILKIARDHDKHANNPFPRKCQHTLGPWFCEDYTVGSLYENRVVCRVPKETSPAGILPSRRCQANLYLISEAPNMFEIIEEITLKMEKGKPLVIHPKGKLHKKCKVAFLCATREAWMNPNEKRK